VYIAQLAGVALARLRRRPLHRRSQKVDRGSMYINSTDQPVINLATWPKRGNAEPHVELHRMTSSSFEINIYQVGTV
jgi:hypothetical protein